MNHLFLIFSFFTITVLSAIAQQQDSSASQATRFIHNKQYQKALELLEPYISGDKDLQDKQYTLDQLHYIKATALFQQKKQTQCQDACKKLLTTFPNSDWKFKAIFLQAESLVHQQHYEKAMRLYQQQATRLFSKQRKIDVANQLIRFAEAFSKPVEKSELNAKAPDYKKAYQLYKEVLDIECGLELRELARFQMIEMLHSQSNYSAIENATVTYLTEFDPAWRGKIGTPERVTLKKNLTALATGKNVALVRLRHAEALHRLNRRAEADSYLFQLIKLANHSSIKASKALIADATWLRLHTLRNKGGLAFDIDEWQTATKKYLKNYPTHIHADKTAFLLGDMLKRHGLEKQAIESHQKYIAGEYNTDLTTSPLTATKVTAEELQNSKTEMVKNKEKAMYTIGLLHQSLADFNKAREAWNLTIAKFPNGSLWAQIQKSLNELDYQQLIHEINAFKKQQEYLELSQQTKQKIDNFIQKHPLDTRVENLLFIRGNIPLSLAKKAEINDPEDTVLISKLNQLAIDQWTPLLSKYTHSNKAKNARFLTATLYQEKFGKLKQAIEIYQSLNDNRSKQRLQTLKSKQLVASSEKVFQIDEQASIKLNSRNIEKVKVHQYWIDMESYFLKSADLSEATKLDVDLVEPDKTWELEIKDFKKYQLSQQTLDIPFPQGKAGVCIIKVESAHFVTTSIVMKSDIDIALRSSKNELIAFAKNWKSQQPASNVKLLIANGDKIIATGKTDPNGVFHSKLKELKSIDAFRVLAVSPSGTATCNQSLRKLFQLPKLTSKAWFQSSRSNIRLGDSFKLTGVIRDAHEGAFIYPEIKKYKLSASVGNTLIKQQEITLSEIGEFSTQLRLPAYLQNPARSVIISLTSSQKKDKKRFRHSIPLTTHQVYKAKFKISLDNDHIKLGDLVTGKISATHRWGAPVTHRQLQLTLPSGKSTNIITDDKGIATFQYDTTGIASGSLIQFSARISSIATARASVSALIDPLELKIKAEADKQDMIAGEELTIDLVTKNAKDLAIPAELTIKLIKRIAPVSLDLISGQSSVIAKEKIIQEIKVTTDKDGKANPKIKFTEDGIFTIRIEGSDTNGKPSFAQTSVNVLGKNSVDTLSLYHHNKKIYDDGTATLQLYSKLEKNTKALMTIETESIIKHRVIDVKTGLNTISIPLQARYAPVFRCSIMTMEKRKFISCEDTITISKKLNISTKLSGVKNGQAQAGSKIKATVEVTDTQGNIVPAILLATLNPNPLTADKTEENTNDSHRYYTPFVRPAKLASFSMSSSCGFTHLGAQTQILATLLDEQDDSANQLENLLPASLSHLNKVEKVRRHSYKGEGFYNLGLYDKANEEFTKILRIDPYNQMARRWQARIQTERIEYYRSAYDETRARLLTEVDTAWEETAGTALLNHQVIPGIPFAENGFNTTTRGLRSDDTAITRDRIDFFLNNPTRTSQVKQSALQQSIRTNSFENYSNRDNTLASNLLPRFNFASLATTSNTSSLPSWSSRSILISAKDEIEIPLPQQAGEWTLNFKAIGKKGRMTEKSHAITTTADFTIKPSSQIVAVEGDQFKPTFSIFRKHSTEAKTINLKIKSTVGKKTKTTTTPVSFKAGENNQTIELETLTATTATTLIFDISIEGENLNNSYRIPVRPWGSSRSVARTVTVKAGQPRSFDLTLPSATQPSQLEISVLPSIDDKLIQLATTANDSAIGLHLPSTEPHPAGKLLAFTALLEYLKDAGAKDSDHYKKIYQLAEWSYTDLIASRKENGSWSLIRSRKRSHLTTTAIAYEAIHYWHSHNKLKHTITDKTADWLKKQYTHLSPKENDSRSLIQLALSHGESADFSLCNRLFRDRGRLSPAGKLFLAEAFINLERPAFAKQLISTLPNPEKWISHHDFLTNDINHLKGRALSVLANLQMSNSPLANQLYADILEASSLNGFSNDISRGVAVLGLTKTQSQKILKNTAPFARAKGSGKVYLNDKLIAEINTAEPLTLSRKLIDKNLGTGANTIKVDFQGQGSLYFSSVLSGFTKGFKRVPLDHKVKERRGVISRQYYHQGLSYKGQKLASPGRTKVTNVEVDQIVNVYFNVVNTVKSEKETTIIEHIPAGFSYLKGSLKGGHSGARLQNDHLVISLQDTIAPRWYSYQLIATQPGIWKQKPTLITASKSPSNIAYGFAGSLTVNPKGQPSSDTYQMTKYEHRELASKFFSNKEYQQAEIHLKYLRSLAGASEDANLAQMTLWVETNKNQPDSKLIVEAFETLDIRMPELSIPFEKILKVGKAYADLNEYERANYVYSATIDAGFTQDSYVAVALGDQGRFLDSIDYQKELWKFYPNSDEVNTAWFVTAQQLFEKSSHFKTIKQRIGTNPENKLKREDLIHESVAMLQQFLTVNPEHISADQASYTIANAFFSLKDYQSVVKHAKDAHRRYPKSSLLNNFKYMQALGSFWQRNFDDAIKASTEVAKGDSDDKNLASYITAQIYHAKGQPDKAIKWYNSVKNHYPDAAQSIAYFEQKKISLDEIKVVKSNNKASINLNYRNIDTAQLKIYKVDLMKLYLKQRNLSDITKVQLAGIAPKFEMEVKLGTNNITQDQQKTIDLPIKNDGAYLIICRGDYLYSSGLVLVTSLKMEVQEQPNATSLRVNIKDQNSGQLLDNVHVKAIGSDNSRYRTGETDLRGIWSAHNIAGYPTVIAKDKKGRYAFFRSKTLYADSSGDPFGGSTEDAFGANETQKEKPAKKIDYNRNLNLKQQRLNSKNWEDYDNKRRQKGNGIKVNKALKK